MDSNVNKDKAFLEQNKISIKSSFFFFFFFFFFFIFFTSKHFEQGKSTCSFFSLLFVNMDSNVNNDKAFLEQNKISIKSSFF